MLSEVEKKIEELTALQVAFSLNLQKETGKNPQTELDRLQAELNRLNILFQKGRISEEYYDNQYDILTEKINRCKEALDTVSGRSLTPIFNSFAGDWKTTYLSLDKEHKQAFWRDKIASIQVDPDTHKLCGFNFLRM